MSEIVDAMLTRLAPLHSRPGTVNVEARTVEVVWSSGAAVKRYDFRHGGHFMEELSMDPKHVRLDRLNAGASFLDTHSQFSIADRIGAIVPGSVRIVGGKGLCTVQLSRSDLGERLLQDLSDGLPLQISVGYRTHRYEKIEGENDALPTLRATDWEPMEVSAVTVPADPAASARSSNQEVTDMSTALAPREFGPAERAEIVEKHGLGGAFLRAHANVPQLEFRAAVLDAVERRQSRTETAPMVDVTVRDERSAGRNDAIVDALMLRIDPKHKPADGSREFVGLSVVEIARASLEATGQRSYGTASDVVSRALNGTSDFPLILGDVLNKSLAKAYTPAAAALKTVARQTTARDFKSKHHLALSEGAALERVNEHGEYKRSSLKESRESYRLETFGRIFSITRQALINDDLSAFADIPSHLARTAAAKEASALASLVAANPLMSDGKAIFHGDHGNLLTAAALDVAALSIARKTMRAQVGLTGELISVTPRFLVVGPEQETAGEQVLAAIAASKVADTNPFTGKLELVVEPRLGGKQWYVAASPSEIDGLEYCYLEGEEGPQIESRPGFDVDGLEVKVRLDFAAGFVDWRSWTKNPGA